MAIFETVLGTIYSSWVTHWLQIYYYNYKQKLKDIDNTGPLG